MQKTVLFICTHNSARSQMAEGLMNEYYSDKFEAFSAGTEPSSVHPYAKLAMGELGIDISRHRSKKVDEFIDKDIDYVVTVCDNAKETCPFFPANIENIHQSFEDPSKVEGTTYDKLSAFRNARREIKKWIDFKFGDKKK